MTQSFKLITLVCALIFISACTQQKPTTGLYLLLDTSGTYTKELKKAQQIIHYYLAQLEPGDSFAVARIDSGSFSETDIIAKVTFDHRPSRANEQKRIFSATISKFIETVQSSAYTDISGGLLLAKEYLNEIGSDKKYIMIFSDMQEELPKGYKRDFELNLPDYEVIALNVTKLRSDNQDPTQYMQRLKDWQQRVEKSGGKWRMINDLEREESLGL
ncbi:VWA domain-containing protein [Bermanella sp. WJH001]|uniref:VWA domain-containing protein n=1 Tax=Bermanella sp. WJH001 TaxID=3048005 RepID=UPI0024BE365F|nr:VWA domain-containing protein [Bermanella sp. WJH001]MDJ1537385.1 VWA domain-containing protein [Bermanella sp. WJH001]